MSPGSVHFLWHTQDVIHCIFHWMLEPVLQVNLTLIMLDLLGTQQRLSVQTPQYVGLNFLVLVQPESFSFSAFFAWNFGLHVFPFGTWIKTQAGVFMSIDQAFIQITIYSYMIQDSSFSCWVNLMMGRNADIRSQFHYCWKQKTTQKSNFEKC